MIESYSTKNISHHRNIIFLMVASPVITMLLLFMTFYISMTNNQGINANAAVLFDGTKTSNWAGKQWTNSCGSYAQDTPVSPSGYAGSSIKVFLKDGCYWGSSGTERVELATPDQFEFQEGSVWYIDFWQRFDQLANTHSGSDWDIWMQTHFPGGGSQPNLIFATDENNKMEFKTSKGCGQTIQWVGSQIQTNRWYRFTLGVKFSSDSNTGWVELKVDGTNILPRKNVAVLGLKSMKCSEKGTVFDATSGYLKKGIYRNPDTTGNETYMLYGLNVYSSDPLSETTSTPPNPSPNPAPSPEPSPSPVPEPGPVPAPEPSPAPSPEPSPATEPPPPVTIPDANPNVPVDIPSDLPVEADGTVIADFTGDGLNDVANDSNSDGKIDPQKEIIIDGSNNIAFTNTSKSPISTEELNQLENSRVASNNIISIKPGPLPEVRIAKPVAYTFLIAQGAAITGIGAYFAITRLSMFAGVRGKLGI